MKRTVKLTESDLARIVRRVIKEQNNDVVISSTPDTEDRPTIEIKKPNYIERYVWQDGQTRSISGRMEHMNVGEFVRNNPGVKGKFMIHPNSYTEMGSVLDPTAPIKRQPSESGGILFWLASGEGNALFYPCREATSDVKKFIHEGTDKDESGQGTFKNVSDGIQLIINSGAGKGKSVKITSPDLGPGPKG